jgi:hypothetical protein
MQCVPQHHIYAALQLTSSLSLCHIELTHYHHILTLIAVYLTFIAIIEANHLL